MEGTHHEKQQRSNFDHAYRQPTALEGAFQGGSIGEVSGAKMTAALEAIDPGARRVLLANGTRPHALRDALAGAIATTEVFA